MQRNMQILLSSITMCIVFVVACDQRAKSGVNVERSGAQWFATVSQAPANDQTRNDHDHGHPPDQPINQNLADVLTGQGPPPRHLIPTLPPIPTDNELFDELDLFGDGPPVAPFAKCGNGRLEPWEQCDDIPPNQNNKDGCNIFCEKPYCGNGVTEANEQCDDGNCESGDGCSSRCQFERCGNFNLDPEEECDDGNLNPNDGCSACCIYEECGNGIVDPKEQCDDGNLTNGDGCSDCCKTETTPAVVEDITTPVDEIEHEKK